MKKTIVMLAILSGLVQAEDNYQAKFDDGWVTLNDLVLHKTSVDSNNNYSDAGDITNGTLTGGNATMSWNGFTEDTNLTLSDSWRISFTLKNVTSAANPIFSTTSSKAPGGYILKVTEATNNEYFLQFGNETISNTALTMNTGYDITLSFIDLVDNKGVSQGGMFIVNVGGDDVYSTRIAATDLGNADFEGSTNNTNSQYSTRLWTNGGKQHFSNVKIETNGRLIPEPTTATLSLLALAGLAARRRRR